MIYLLLPCAAEHVSYRCVVVNATTSTDIWYLLHMHALYHSAAQTDCPTALCGSHAAAGQHAHTVSASSDRSSPIDMDADPYDTDDIAHGVSATPRKDKVCGDTCALEHVYVTSLSRMYSVYVWYTRPRFCCSSHTDTACWNSHRAGCMYSNRSVIIIICSVSLSG